MPLLTRTRADLVNRSLAILNVVGAGQSASAEDFDLMNTLVDTTLADLEARVVVYVGDPEQIDVAIFEDLASCLAEAGRNDFGAPELDRPGAVAEASLRYKQAGRPTYQTQRTSYY